MNRARAQRLRLLRLRTPLVEEEATQYLVHDSVAESELQDLDSESIEHLVPAQVYAGDCREPTEQELAALDAAQVASAAGLGKATPIVRPPGSILLHIADCVYSQKTCERVFRQIVADMREEHYRALAEGRGWKAWWILWRGRLGFVGAVLRIVSTGIADIVAGPIGRLIRNLGD